MKFRDFLSAAEVRVNLGKNIPTPPHFLSTLDVSVICQTSDSTLGTFFLITKYFPELSSITFPFPKIGAIFENKLEHAYGSKLDSF